MYLAPLPPAPRVPFLPSDPTPAPCGPLASIDPPPPPGALILPFAPPEVAGNVSFAVHPLDSKSCCTADEEGSISTICSPTPLELLLLYTFPPRPPEPNFSTYSCSAVLVPPPPLGEVVLSLFSLAPPDPPSATSASFQS